MKIESLIRRKLGSTVVLDDMEYHFKPEQHTPDAPHVCEVKNEAHQRILLANKSFARLGDKPKPKYEPLTAPPPPPEPESEPDEPAGIDAMTKSELLKYADANGISLDKKLPKNAILNRIRQAESGDA